MTNTKAGTRAKTRLTLTLNDLTPLQRQFSRAKAMRRAMQEYLAAETGLLRGYKRMYNGLFRETIAGMTDNQIRDVLYYALQCDDITPEERAEIRRILRI